MNADKSLPSFFAVTQDFPRKVVEDVEAVIANTFRDTQSLEKIEKGQQVAIAVGSRGINQLSRIVLAVVNEIKNLGAVPVIVPAMGSHGGATAEGQSRPRRFWYHRICNGLLYRGFHGHHSFGAYSRGITDLF